MSSKDYYKQPSGEVCEKGHVSVIVQVGSCVQREWVVEGGSQRSNFMYLYFLQSSFNVLVISLASVSLIFEKLHKCLIGHLFAFKDSIKGDKVSKIWPLCKYNKKKKRSSINAKYSSTTNTHIL